MSCVAAVVVTLAWPSAALADVVKIPPVATNFEARIAAATLGSDALRARVVDGDRQLWLRVNEDTTVSIAGAEGEPLLLFDHAGVFVNARSLTAAADRVSRVPGRVAPNPRTRPVWHRLTRGHSFLWHDHRLHALEPLAKGHRTKAVIGRWSIPISIDGNKRLLAGELTYEPPGALWPWLLVAGLLAAGVWLGLAVARSPAAGSTIAAALVVTVVVWVLRIGRELYGRPAVGPGGYVLIGLTSGLGLVFFFGLLHRSEDVRVFTALFVGLGALYQGLVMFKVLTHSIALTALPTSAAKLGVAMSLGLGAGLVAIVLRGTPERRSVDDAVRPGRYAASSAATGSGAGV